MSRAAMVMAMLVGCSSSLHASDVPSHPKRATVRVSEGSITVLRLSKDDAVSSLVIDPRSGIRAEIASPGIVALTGSPSDEGVRMIVNRGSGRSVELLLTAGAFRAPVRVVDLDDGSRQPVSRWSVHQASASPSVLASGFEPVTVLRTDGVDVDVAPGTGTVTALRRSGSPVDVVVLGRNGEAGIHRLD
jgi:hypothetical protein